MRKSIHVFLYIKWLEIQWSEIYNFLCNVKHYSNFMKIWLLDHLYVRKSKNTLINLIFWFGFSQATMKISLTKINFLTWFFSNKQKKASLFIESSTTLRTYTIIIYSAFTCNRSSEKGIFTCFQTMLANVSSS